MDESFAREEKRYKSVIKIKKSNVWSTSNSFSESFSPSQNSDFFSKNLTSFSNYIEDKEEEIFQEEELLPESIEGEYVYDYDILKIHRIILKKFEQDKSKKVETIEQKLSLENEKILGRQTIIERKSSKKKIENFEEEIERINQDVEKERYFEKTGKLLEEYKKLKPILQVKSFVSKNKTETNECPETEEEQFIRHKIISEYLESARNYININLIRVSPNGKSCPGCGTNYNEIELIEDDSGFTICPVCSLEKTSIYKNPFFSDGCRVNNSRNNYEDRANFEKVLLRYQGKQQTKPDKSLYKKLDDYFKIKGLPSSEEYLKLPILPNGTKEGTSRELMFEALAAIGCSGYYDDINLICNIFFGWLLPDVTHLEDDIMMDYDIFHRAYENLPDREGRKSSLNSQWVLYVLLKKRGWPCKSKDFKIPMTQDIKEYHKMKTKEIFNNLGWKQVF